MALASFVGNFKGVFLFFDVARSSSGACRRSALLVREPACRTPRRKFLRTPLVFLWQGVIVQLHDLDLWRKRNVQLGMVIFSHRFHSLRDGGVAKHFRTRMRVSWT
jgi:hypothetical protein